MKVIHSSVVVGLSGGLGNQLFQYAAGRALSLKLGVGLILDTSWFHGQSERTYALDAFSINADIYSGPIFLPDWVKRLECRLTRKWARTKLGVPVYREPHFHFDDAYTLLGHPVYMEGFWQTERYFMEYKKIISTDLTLKAMVTDQYKLIVNNIQSSDAICIHIRRGDYITNQVASETHGFIPINYIYEGIKEISKNLLKPHCFIFSDDPDWVRKNLILELPHTVVDIAASNEAYLDLTLMKQCNHFIIANSSLSWWGAWLSESANKKVIAPMRWFKTNKHKTIDLIPNNWIRL